MSASHNRQQDAISKRIHDYIDRTGLTAADFAARIGYAKSTLNLFLSGRYAAMAQDASLIAGAASAFMDRHPIETAPEEAAGNLYVTENVRRIRKCFHAALDERRAYFFRGAPGSQKSFVLSHLVAELNRAEISKNGHGRRAYHIYCRQGIKPTQLMKRIAVKVGAPAVGGVDRILANLRFEIGARKSLLVFDEAQHLSVQCLETVRELHDEAPRCGLLFAGSHELEQIFNRLDMEQWHSRIHRGEELPGLSEAEAVEIITGELGRQKAEKVQKLVRSCYATDMRKGREVKYISARTLFFAISSIKERQEVTA